MDARRPGQLTVFIPNFSLSALVIELGQARVVVEHDVDLLA